MFKNTCSLLLKSIRQQKPFINETVNMYASPAYGTHQVFAEPGLDHLYERIDDKMTTTLQDTSYFSSL